MNTSFSYQQKAIISLNSVEQNIEQIRESVSRIENFAVNELTQMYPREFIFHFTSEIKTILYGTSRYIFEAEQNVKKIESSQSKLLEA